MKLNLCGRERAAGRERMPAPQPDVCLALRGMQDAEGASGVGPDQHQGIAVLRNAGERLLHIGGGMHGVAVNFRDHLTRCRPALSAGLPGVTCSITAPCTSSPACSCCRSVRRQVRQAKAPARLTMAGVGALAVVVTFSHRFQRDRQSTELPSRRALRWRVVPG